MPTSEPGFSWGTDGWGLVAIHAEGCKKAERASVGEATCVPLDDCSAPFPPAEADLVVSKDMTGPRVVADLQTALDRAPRGGVVAVDTGRWGSTSVHRDVSIVGRCARDAVVGNGKNNALYVNGARVVVSGVTLASSASPIGVQSGSVEADHIIVSEAQVGVAVASSKSKVTLRRSIIEGTGADSLGVMAAQGGTILIEDSELRDVTAGVMVTDKGSQATLVRSIVSVVGHAPKDAVLVANAQGRLVVEGSVVRSNGATLVAVHRDAGTRGSSAERSGSMTIRTSVLEQLGAEMKDRPAVDLDGGELELFDVTLRHRSPIGILADGTLTVERTAILGDLSTAELRAGIMAGSGSVSANALAIPWAQGIGVGVSGATLDLRDSLVSNVAAREGSGEAILVSHSTATISGCELADNERGGIVSMADSSLVAERVYVHAKRDGDAVEGRAGVFALSTNATFDGCVFEQNGEGIVASSSSVALRSTSFFGHDVAVRAMDGMSVVENMSESLPEVIAIAGDCRFAENATRTSLETRPSPQVELPKHSRK